MNYFSSVQSMSHSYLLRCLPAVPSQFYTSVGSTFVAAALGGTYGLIGRVVYPHIGISPLHYSIWFALAFQIKKFICTAESRLGHFLSEKFDLEHADHSSKNRVGFYDRMRNHYWQLIQCKEHLFERIDSLVCRILNIHPYEWISSHNVEDASFLEMCRYRMWTVFKSAILDALSLTVAYRFSSVMGFTLPARTSAPLLMMIGSIVKDVILVPALYVYARWHYRVDYRWGVKLEGCNSTYRTKWIYRCLPSL